MTTQTQTDDLHLLIATLPQSLQEALEAMPQKDLLEIIMDLGRPPQARFPGRALNLAETALQQEDLDQVVTAIGEFGADNRAGIEGTLHRISAIRNRKGQIIGLTLRVGRAVFGTIDLIRDLVEGGANLLLLGPPGVGKTTKLREIARVLADDFSKRVIVIDTSNEIAGDGDVPHPAIGAARRMQVPHPNQQHAVMIEAVENHMPEVIIVDEIGTEAEALAARTIAERGVQLIGTAHGNTLENLVMNPTLCDLVGGVQTVTLGDEEARLRRSQKTISERKAPPTFDMVVEIQGLDEVMVHTDTAHAVDNLLRGRDPGGLRRTPQGEEPFVTEEPLPRPAVPQPGLPEGLVRIYPYALSRDSVERVIRDLRLEARTVPHPEQASMIVTLRARADDPRLRRIVEATSLPVYEVKKNTTAQIRRLLQGVFNVLHSVDEDEVKEAVSEAEEAVQRVLEQGVIAELAPRPASLRKLQHRVIMGHFLVAESVGCEPQRHLVVYPSE
jgi:stage III sporulation protein SpoIIIAA